MDKLRTHRILAYLKQRGSCTLEELMQEFDVSSATIHRDVDELAKRDAVTKVRGGLLYNAVPAPRAVAASGFQERVVTNRRAKLAIAKRALALVNDGDILFLDSSTTVGEFARLLRDQDFGHLTIVTNSVSIIQEFHLFPSHWVLIGLGGTYDLQLNSILGGTALEQLARLNVTKAFVSAFGMDGTNVTTNHERQAEMIRCALDNAEKRFLLLDKTKDGRIGLYRLARRGAFDAIVTD